MAQQHISASGSYYTVAHNSSTTTVWVIANKV